MQEVTRLLRSLGLATVLAAGGVLAAGCDSTGISGIGGGAIGGKKKSVKSTDGSDKTDQGGDVNPDGTKAGAFTKAIDNSGAGFQVKDIDLLRSSVTACMGDGYLTISDEMLLAPLDATTPPPALTDAKIRFLLPTQYKSGDDVINSEKGNLVDEIAGPRTNTTADSLTDTYLRSLETVGNVIAHNCSMDKPECQCETKAKAHAMLTRCLPGLDPQTKEMDEASALLSGICNINGPEGMRKAVASMIASYPFASAR